MFPIISIQPKIQSLSSNINMLELYFGTIARVLETGDAAHHRCKDFDTILVKGLSASRYSQVLT